MDLQSSQHFRDEGLEKRVCGGRAMRVKDEFDEFERRSVVLAADRV
jgi:hypothetical protein